MDQASVDSASRALSLRAPNDDDFDAIVAVFAAQDIDWWGTVDGDADDIREEMDRVVLSAGSLVEGARVVVDDTGVVIGVGLHVGHGQTNVAIDPLAPQAVRAQELLVDWLIRSGASRIDAPAQDRARLELLHARGFVPISSSFDLERSADVDDLDAPQWPDGISVVPFRAGVDEQAVHDLIYSVWTDVEGHTFRPIEEWRTIFVGGSSFDPELVVLTRHDDGTLAGVAMCRTFAPDIGWVSQLAVGRPGRGVGLGRAILVEALRRLATREVTILGLSVEAKNDKALGLYRSVGLEVTREWMHCGRDARE